MVNFETEVIRVIKRNPGVKSLRFGLKHTVEFKPGQFFFVEINVDGQKRTKHFSFSNSPTEKGYIEFTKRITKSPFSRALDSLKKGSHVRLKMPYGDFTFTGEYTKIAFLSGGIGITPIRSMCKFVTDKKMETDVMLLYGNSREEDIIFRDDFDKMQVANKRLRVVHTLTASEVNKNAWAGRTGYIDRTMIKEEIPDYAERVFYLCGPPLMVEKLKETLKSGLQIEEGSIKTENFTGY